MKVFVALLALGAVASAQTIISRAPAFDSAVIKSDRVGGNFAYSVAENHAYAAQTPIIQNVATPMAYTYSAPSYTYAAAAPVAYSYKTNVVAPMTYSAPIAYKTPMTYAATSPVVYSKPVAYTNFAAPMTYTAASPMTYAAAPAVAYTGAAATPFIGQNFIVAKK